MAKWEGSSLPPAHCADSAFSGPRPGLLESITVPAWTWRQLGLRFQNAFKQAEIRAICKGSQCGQMHVELNPMGAGGDPGGGPVYWPTQRGRARQSWKATHKNVKQKHQRQGHTNSRARLWLSAVATGGEALCILRQVVQALFQMLLPESAHLDFSRACSHKRQVINDH